MFTYLSLYVFTLFSKGGGTIWLHGIDRFVLDMSADLTLISLLLLWFDYILTYLNKWMFCHTLGMRLEWLPLFKNKKFWLEIWDAIVVVDCKHLFYQIRFQTRYLNCTRFTIFYFRTYNMVIFVIIYFWLSIRTKS